MAEGHKSLAVELVEQEYQASLDCEGDFVWNWRAQVFVAHVSFKVVIPSQELLFTVWALESCALSAV